MSNSRMNGEIAEMAFLLKASKLGLNVSRPVPTLSYDFIIDCGQKLCRVQVKCTNQDEKGRNGYPIIIKRGNKNNIRGYTKKDCDFFAFYIAKLDTWYIIPVDEIEGLKIGLRPDSKTSKYNTFKEAWQLLRK